MRQYLFDDWRSVVHAVLGAICAIGVHLEVGILSALAFLIFILYELPEPESPVATIGDVFEFVIGYLLVEMVIHSSAVSL